MDEAAFPDERLELIFTCCHPALATEAQVALTLRTLGGLTTGEIARAFLVPERFKIAVSIFVITSPRAPSPGRVTITDWSSSASSRRSTRRMSPGRAPSTNTGPVAGLTWLQSSVAIRSRSVFSCPWKQSCVSRRTSSPCFTRAAAFGRARRQRTRCLGILVPACGTPVQWSLSRNLVLGGHTRQPGRGSSSSPTLRGRRDPGTTGPCRARRRPIQVSVASMARRKQETEKSRFSAVLPRADGRRLGQECLLQRSKSARISGTRPRRSPPWPGGAAARASTRGPRGRSAPWAGVRYREGRSRGISA